MKLRSWGSCALLAVAGLAIPAGTAWLDNLDEQPGWTISKYGVANLQGVGSSLSIEAADEGGAQLERGDLDARKAYRLKISGAARFADPMLSIQSDDRLAKSSRAPHGDLEITITKSERLKVTIRGIDEHFQYRVRLSLWECNDCVSDEQLRSKIVAEIPNIDSEIKADLLPAVQKLLRWTARKEDLGGHVPGFVDMTGVMDLLPASQIYEELWKSHRGGTSCAGFAVFFGKVLALFGIESFVVDIGYLGTYLTHVTTVVPIESATGFKFYVFDPTFGGVYLSRSDTYADLQLALTEPKSVVFSAQPVFRTAIVSNADWRGFHLQALRLRRDPKCHGTGGYRICERLAYDKKWLLYGWRPILKQHGIPKKADLILTLLKHRLISSSATGLVRQAFRAMLASSRG